MMWLDAVQCNCGYFEKIEEIISNLEAETAAVPLLSIKLLILR